MELIKNYNNALEAIYSHVGFVGNWEVAPIDDCTDFFWRTDGDHVYFADSKEELKAEKCNYYEEPIFKHASYKKWIYKGKDITLIICDSQTDGMWWFQIFDNTKRLPMEMKK